nr:uncharacterized protein LOC109170104 isoform X2 [Ipomoea batatas]
MGPMLKGFIREELRSLCTRQEDGQGATVLNQGIEINIVTGNIEGEAGAEVKEGMSVIATVERNETILPEAEAAVRVRITAKIVREVDMMMRGAVEVVLMEVPLLLGAAQVQGGAHLLEGLPLGMEAQKLGITMNVL